MDKEGNRPLEDVNRDNARGSEVRELLMILQNETIRIIGMHNKD